MGAAQRSGWQSGLFLLRLLIGAMFVAHLYWKIAVLPGGLQAWWAGLISLGYPGVVPAYVLSAEVAGALLLIPGIFARYVALYAIPMMIGAAHFWLVRNGFYFTNAGAELPLVWLALLCIQVVSGDGAYAIAASPDWRDLLARLGFGSKHSAPEPVSPLVSEVQRSSTSRP